MKAAARTEAAYPRRARRRRPPERSRRATCGRARRRSRTTAATRGNTCTDRHRIGSLDTCGRRDVPTFGEQPAKMLQSIGRAPHRRLGAAPGTIGTYPPEAVSARRRSCPHSYWMPVGNDLTLEAWRVIYDDVVAALERCRADHDAPGCIVEPIQSKASWLARLMTAHRGPTVPAR